MSSLVGSFGSSASMLHHGHILEFEADSTTASSAATGIYERIDTGPVFVAYFFRTFKERKTWERGGICNLEEHSAMMYLPPKV
jgi:hypothetical protein